MSGLFGAGVARGADQGATYARGADERNLQMKQAKLKQQQAQASFDAQQAQAPIKQEGMELELQQLRNQVGQQNAQVVKQQAIDGIGRFQADGDTKHLNTWIEQVKKNPLGEKLHGDITRFDPISNTPQNTKLLKEAGIANAGEVYNNPDRFKHLTILTRTDGSQVVADTNLIANRVGYDKYMSQADLERRDKESIISARLSQGMSVSKSDRIDKVIASLRESNPEMTYAEAFEQVQGMGTRTNMSGAETAIQQIMKSEQIEYLEAAEKYYDMKNGQNKGSDRDKYIKDFMANTEGATRMDAQAAYDKRTPTSTQKELGSVEEIKDSLDEQNFFEMDMGKATPQEKAQLHRKIAQIEDLRDIKFSTEDKRVMRDFSNLTKLAGNVGDTLTEEETGIMDTMLASVKGYLVDEVGGKAATSAYHTFRNNMRRTLSGQSLTEAEIKAFEQSAGSLKQQLKPALASFRTQVQTVKNQMEAIRDTNDPYLAQYYLGKDLGEVDDVIRNLDARLGDLNKAGKFEPSSVRSRKDKRDGAPVNTTADRIKAQSQSTQPAPGTPVDMDALWKSMGEVK